ncbi:MAG: phage holin family protein [Alcanivoracaceae bacterium]
MTDETSAPENTESGDVARTEANPVNERSPGADSTGPEQQRRQDDAAQMLVRDLSRISAGFADLFRDSVALLKAESRLFASTLLLILVLAVVTGFLLAGATLLLVATPVVLLIELGWVGPTAALVAVLVMLVLVAVLLMRLIARLGRELVFRRSRAALGRWSGRDQDGAA